MFVEWATRLAQADLASILTGVLTLSAFLVVTFQPSRAWRSLPLVNGKRPFELSYAKARKRYQADAKNLISAGFQKTSNAFRLVTDNGTRIILPKKYVDELRNHPHLSFSRFTASEFHANIPGFDAFNVSSSDNPILVDAVRTKLTQAVGRVTQPLSEETTDALQKNWTDNPGQDWHELVLKSSILNIVAQLSSKVFLGDELCRNPDWLRITKEYTVDSMMAAHALRLWPKFLRWFASWFLPSCQKLRAEVKETREIITPVIEQRRAKRAALIKAGKPLGKTFDAIEWIEECSKGRPYDPAIAQLILSLAAIHTTSDMITQVIYDICEHPDLIQPMREEIISVIQEDGWKKTALYKLKLMDSVLKESQRLKPTSRVSMRRVATNKIKLADGIEIPKGTAVMVSTHGMWDDSIYPEADKFDGYRFFNLRQTPGQENSSQLVTTSPDHLGFGHGQHACPGRFFAANEAKIALCHILLKYDIKAVNENEPIKIGINMMSNPKGKVAIRRRDEEIAL